MQPSLHSLPALNQISLALEHRGFEVTIQGEHLSIRSPWLPGPVLELGYRDQVPSALNQCLELQLPLDVRLSEQRRQEWIPLLLRLNGCSGGLRLCLDQQRPLLRWSQLHPRQMPDLRIVVGQLTAAFTLWARCRMLLSPYTESENP